MSTEALAQLEAHSGIKGLGVGLKTALTNEAARESAAAILTAVGTAQPTELAQAWLNHPDQLLGTLTALLTHAPFFGPILLHHPTWLIRLVNDRLDQPRSAEQYEQSLTQRLAELGGLDADAGAETALGALRRFKYYELARITLRELDADLIPDERESEVLAEISALADALLAAALQLAESRVRARLGRARTLRPLPGFVILGLGKLGANELNYSSDVDLIYVFDPNVDPLALELDGSNEIAPVEYYTRLAQEFGRAVATKGRDGFLYRVDLELRPEGTQGPLVIAGSAFVQYYDTWAATWERAAAMKARPVAGDLAFGWQLIRALAPMLYRSSVDYESVAAITELKTRSAAARDGDGDLLDIKHGSGGIRDVETIAQALQLLHGGRMPQVRQRASVAALQGLAEVGVLDRDDANALLAAYRFLRRLEHRVQMIAERQTHTLPRTRPELEAIGRSLGFGGTDPATELETVLARHRDTVRELMRHLFPEDTAERIMTFFATRMPDLLGDTTTREAMNGLAAHFAREIEGGPNPQRALNNLERFTAGIGRRRFYYELMLDRPELVPRLATLFATSEHLSGYLATYPRLIEPIFNDPSVLLLAPPQLERDFDELGAQLASEHGGVDTESELDTLRLFHHRELVNVGLLDLVNKISRREAETALTDIAEVCLRRALLLAGRKLAQRQPPRPDATFLVVGMGKVASRELTYGSDLDVIFLYDVPAADEYELGAAQDYFVRLAQKLIWALCTRTATGLCYEVDARLRPSGNQGPLVTSLSGFRNYHAASAQVWERQALLRARPIAGDPGLAAQFEQERRQILNAALPEDLAQQVHRVRLRMEGELARETSQRHDFKTGHGGLLDVETIVQLLQLRHSGEHPELIEVKPIAAQIERLDQLKRLNGEDAALLQHGWDFLQRLSSRLRIVENRSISDLDEERGDLDSLAGALGYTSPQRHGGARRALLEDYRRHTMAVREIYLRVVSGDPVQGPPGHRVKPGAAS